MAKTATQSPIVKMPKTVKTVKIPTVKLPKVSTVKTKMTYPKMTKPAVSKGLSGYMSTKSFGTTAASSNNLSKFA